MDFMQIAILAIGAFIGFSIVCCCIWITCCRYKSKKLIRSSDNLSLGRYEQFGQSEPSEEDEVEALEIDSSQKEVKF